MGLALVGSLLAGPSRGAPQDAAAILARLSRRDAAILRQKKVVILEGGTASRVTGLVVFERPVEDVMRLLSQTTRQTEYRPELDAERTVATYPDGTVEEQDIRILFRDIKYFLHYHVDVPARRITWSLDPTHHNDLRQVSGFWELYAWGDARTLGRFGTQVDVGGLPAFLQDYATRRKLPQTLENARRWVDSDGRWRP